MGTAILTTGDAAKRLDVSGEYLRRLVREGRLSATKTTSGQHLFEEGEIERLRLEREAARRAKAGGQRSAHKRVAHY